MGRLQWAVSPPPANSTAMGKFEIRSKILKVNGEAFSDL